MLEIRYLLICHILPTYGRTFNGASKMFPGNALGASIFAHEVLSLFGLDCLPQLGDLTLD